MSDNRKLIEEARRFGPPHAPTLPMNMHQVVHHLAKRGGTGRVRSLAELQAAFERAEDEGCICGILPDPNHGPNCAFSYLARIEGEKGA